MSLIRNIDCLYGPYTQKPDGRKLVHVRTKDGRLRRIPYPKFLVEVALGRELDPNEETVDHIDKDFHNNSWSNLRVVDRSTHVSEDHVKVQLILTRCAWCEKETKKAPSQIRDKARRKQAGPFCSKRCVGVFSTTKQKNELPEAAVWYHQWDQYTDITPIYYSVIKTGETVLDAATRLDLPLLSEAEIMAAVPKPTPRPTKPKYPCAVCGTQTKNLKFCSSVCSHKNQQRIKWPSPEKLQHLVWKYPTSYIAKRLGVSDVTVAKHCRKHNIDKPPRGYWRKKQCETK